MKGDSRGEIGEGIEEGDGRGGIEEVDYGKGK